MKAENCEKSEWYDVTTISDGMNGQRQEICATIGCNEKDCDRSRVLKGYPSYDPDGSIARGLDGRRRILRSCVKPHD